MEVHRRAELRCRYSFAVQFVSAAPVNTYESVINQTTFAVAVCRYGCDHINGARSARDDSAVILRGVGDEKLLGHFCATEAQ
jgi:hypothetical protein